MLKRSVDFFVSAVLAENRLKILPDTTLLTKQVGSNVGLTCKAEVEDPNLIGHMEWFDPLGRKIENTYKNLPIYVQVGCYFF